MTALELFTTLRGLDVIVKPWLDRLCVDAPVGVLTDALRQALRTHKAALLDLVEAFEERASIAEYCAGLTHEKAEALAWQCVLEQEAAAAMPVQVAS